MEGRITTPPTTSGVQTRARQSKAKQKAFLVTCVLKAFVCHLLLLATPSIEMLVSGQAEACGQANTDEQPAGILLTGQLSCRGWKICEANLC
jgi:hypothetical protein